jgi:SulP family sulfate permease
MLYHLPIATLAAIIIIAVSDLIKIEPIIEAWKVQKKMLMLLLLLF